MEYKVHRCKFSDWKPSGIHTITVDSFSALVAIGREDGSIELCNANQKWFVQARIPGCEDFQLRHLVFSSVELEQGRLFGISLRGVLFEVDFVNVSIKNIRDSYGGAAWSLASTGRAPILAVGCEDGAARLFTYEGGRLEYLRSLSSTGARVLSLSFHPRLSQLYMGCADGTIRCVDDSSGKNLFRLTGDIFRGLSTHIWSLLVLSDSTVVSGDNRGHLQFWDGVTGVLMSTLHQHTADILCIAADKDETQVFASGVDSKVICVKRISATFRLPSELPEDVSRQDPGHSQWVYTTAHRPHTHDVHALAVCPSTITTYADGKRSVSSQESLLSGGVDSKLCIYSIGDFMKSRPTWVLPTPASGLIAASRDHSILSMRHGSHLNIWKLDMKRSTDTVTVASRLEDPALQLDARLEVSDSAFLHCSAMSPDGLYIVVSSSSGTRMYSVNSARSVPATDYFTPIELPAELSRFMCQTLVFSPDGQSLMAVYASPPSGTNIALLNVHTESIPANLKKKRKIDNNKAEEAKERPAGSVSVRHIFRHSSSVRDAMLPTGSFSGMLSSGSPPQAVGNLLNGLEHVCHLSTYNADSKYFAVASASGRVYVYEAEGLSLHWRLPVFPYPVSALSFHTQSASSLVVVLADNSFWIFDVSLRQLTPWSTQYADKIPAAIRNIPGAIEGVVFDVDRPSVVIFYGQGFSVFADLNDVIPDVPKRITPMLSATDSYKKTKKKRKSLANSEHSSNFAIVSTYRSLVHVACSTGAELIVMENPWVHVLGTLPDTLSRDRYGT